MKTINRILFFLPAVMSLASCSGILIKDPQDKLTPEAYFTSEKDCELYTNEFYLIFPGAGSIYSENADYIITRDLSDEVRGTRLVPASSSLWNWDRLRDINFFLEHSHQCQDVAVRTKYEALARFSARISISTRYVIMVMFHGSTRPSQPSTKISTRVVTAARWCSGTCSRTSISR